MIIKVRQREFETKPGDYIMYNGACYQFATGDKRGLYFEAWSERTSVVLPKVMVRKIPFYEMKKVIKGELIFWFFV